MISERKSVDFSSAGANPNFKCHNCDKKPLRVEYEIYEPSDEAFTDYHYFCLNCGHNWWVDGIDS